MDQALNEVIIGDIDMENTEKSVTKKYTRKPRWHQITQDWNNILEEMWMELEEFLKNNSNVFVLRH